MSQLLWSDVDNQDDSDDNIAQNDDINNYKGIFHNEDEPDQRYFEHGAHFQYKDLYRRLQKALESMGESRYGKIENDDSISFEQQGKSSIIKLGQNYKKINTKLNFMPNRNVIAKTQFDNIKPFYNPGPNPNITHHNLNNLISPNIKNTSKNKTVYRHNDNTVIISTKKSVDNYDKNNTKEYGNMNMFSSYSKEMLSSKLNAMKTGTSKSKLVPSSAKPMFTKKVNPVSLVEKLTKTR